MNWIRKYLELSIKLTKDSREYIFYGFNSEKKKHFFAAQFITEASMPLKTLLD